MCDFKGHCVAVFSETGQFKARIGSEKVTCFPNGIDISDAGDILIGDSHGNRFHVACYNRHGELQCEYECPYVKVSTLILFTYWVSSYAIIEVIFYELNENEKKKFAYY